VTILTPSPSKERGRSREEGLSPLLNTPWGVGLFSQGIERGEYGVKIPFKKFSSLSPYQGGRDKG